MGSYLLFLYLIIEAKVRSAGGRPSVVIPGGNKRFVVVTGSFNDEAQGKEIECKKLNGELAHFQNSQELLLARDLMKTVREPPYCYITAAVRSGNELAWPEERREVDNIKWADGQPDWSLQNKCAFMGDCSSLTESMFLWQLGVCENAHNTLCQTYGEAENNWATGISMYIFVSVICSVLLGYCLWWRVRICRQNRIHDEVYTQPSRLPDETHLLSPTSNLASTVTEEERIFRNRNCTWPLQGSSTTSSVTQQFSPMSSRINTGSRAVVRHSSLTTYASQLHRNFASKSSVGSIRSLASQRRLNKIIAKYAKESQTSVPSRRGTNETGTGKGISSSIASTASILSRKIPSITTTCPEN